MVNRPPVRKTVGLNQGRYPCGVLDSRFGWIVVREGGMAFAGAFTEGVKSVWSCVQNTFE
jgi:hypothetical protein